MASRRFMSPSPGRRSRDLIGKTGVPRDLVLRPQVAEQPTESQLERVIVLPDREVRDEILSDLDGRVLADIGIEAFPIPDHIEGHQADREQLPLTLLDLGLACLADLRL